ncbi:MAG: hypothetical protein EON55_19260, partial [Alphaproteobacteria bacterium]
MASSTCSPRAGWWRWAMKPPRHCAAPEGTTSRCGIPPGAARGSSPHRSRTGRHGIDASGFVTAFAYDSRGNVLSQTRYVTA